MESIAGGDLLSLCRSHLVVPHEGNPKRFTLGDKLFQNMGLCHDARSRIPTNARHWDRI